MSKIKHFLRAIAVIVPMLALCGISPAALALGTGIPSPWVGKTLWGSVCQGARIPFGPYDYLRRDKFPGQLFVTEEYHLTPEILRLQQATMTSAINDIQYTLMGWPNHHKALYAAYQYRLKNRGEWRQDITSATPVECHLQRAIKFSPRDPVPYMILGLLLHSFEQYEPALESFRTANRLLPNDVITQYNMGLTLVELEMYEEAIQVAEEVYRTDFPLQGLKNKLARAGHWNAESAEVAEVAEVAEEILQEVESTPQTPVPEESVPADDERVDSSIVRE